MIFRVSVCTLAFFCATASWFCDHGLCPSVVGDYIAHRDRTHISQSYAGFLTDVLEDQIHLGPAETGVS